MKWEKLNYDSETPDYFYFYSLGNYHIDIVPSEEQVSKGRWQCIISDKHGDTMYYKSKLFKAPELAAKAGVSFLKRKLLRLTQEVDKIKIQGGFI